MIRFSLPKWVSTILKKPLRISEYSAEEIALLKAQLSKFSPPDPLVSVVIPAWNEEEGILHTLHALAASNTSYKTELLIIDNNSTDGTAALLNQLGVKTILETKQGVGHARTCGLHQAKGKYILTGDSDTLYPPGWITAMAKCMIDGQATPVFCVHGTYSFLPGPSTPRWQYALYEVLSGFIIRKKEKTQPFLNVLGFNTGFLREKGIEVNGYDIETQRIFRGAAGVAETNATEDGMMGLRLQAAGGKIAVVNTEDARVWTSDRRIQMDGGLRKALTMRVKKHLFKR
ncbi:MAG: glycosyltransferase family 2 protein [Ferruginibacter sp.]